MTTLFATGTKDSVTHRVLASELAPVAALIGSEDPALAVRAAATLMTRLLLTRLPGPGCRLLREDFAFSGHLAEGDEVTISAEVEAPTNPGVVHLRCAVRLADGSPILTGFAELTEPAERKGDLAAPFGTQPRRLLAAMLLRCASRPPVPTAIAHPCDGASLRGVWLGANHGLITPILCGPEARIRAVAEAEGLDISGFEILSTPHSHASAEQAVRLVTEGKAAALMKGSLHTDELMGAALARDAGLRTERRVSHCFVMDAPLYPRPLIITDAAINIDPDLDAKADIIRNAIALAAAMGLALPRIALLSAVETVTSKMVSTLHAAALCKMADRGQITGALLDGPLAFDNAVSPAAARAKGIVSAVAGRADVLVCPDIESGNMLAKQLALLGGAASSGIVLGLRVPMALTSRSDDANSRLASAALLRLMAS